jgi:hypothetical protein
VADQASRAVLPYASTTSVASSTPVTFSSCAFAIRVASPALSSGVTDRSPIAAVCATEV